MDAVLAHPYPYDAVIQAGDGEHGREGRWPLSGPEGKRS